MKEEKNMDDEKFSKIARLADDMDRFNLRMRDLSQAFEERLTRLVTEIEGGLIEAGYSPEAQGSKKEMYDRVEKARGDAVCELFFFRGETDEICRIFAAIGDGLDKEFGVRRRRGEIQGREKKEGAKRNTDHTEEG